MGSGDGAVTGVSKGRSQPINLAADSIVASSSQAESKKTRSLRGRDAYASSKGKQVDTRGPEDAREHLISSPHTQALTGKARGGDEARRYHTVTKGQGLWNVLRANFDLPKSVWKSGPAALLRSIIDLNQEAHPALKKSPHVIHPGDRLQLPTPSEVRAALREGGGSPATRVTYTDDSSVAAENEPVTEAKHFFDHRADAHSTLNGIAGRYRVSPEQLLAYNSGLTDASAVLPAGHVIRIPADLSASFYRQGVTVPKGMSVHAAQPGDTLIGIAVRLKMPLHELHELNPHIPSLHYLRKYETWLVVPRTVAVAKKQPKPAQVLPLLRITNRGPSVGDGVLVLRNALNALIKAGALGDYSRLPADSSTYDEDVRDAVVRYQDRRDLGVDGEVGSATWTALQADLGDSKLGSVGYLPNADSMHVVPAVSKRVEKLVRAAAKRQALESARAKQDAPIPPAPVSKPVQSPERVELDTAVAADASNNRAILGVLGEPPPKGAFRVGSRRPATSWWQRLSNRLHAVAPDKFARLEVDSSFGPASQKQLIALQKHLGLTPNGIAKSATGRAILSRAANLSNLPAALVKAPAGASQHTQHVVSLVHSLVIDDPMRLQELLDRAGNPNYRPGQMVTANDINSISTMLENIGMSLNSASMRALNVAGGQADGQMGYGEARAVLAVVELLVTRSSPRQSWTHGKPRWKAAKYDKRIRSAAAWVSDLDPLLLKALAWTESGYNANAESNRHKAPHLRARGLMQLMPPTAKEVATWRKSLRNLPNNITDPQLNLNAGALYFTHLRDSVFGGDTRLAIWAYNGGQGAVRSAGKNAPHHQAEHYLSKVTGVHAWLAAQGG